MYFSLHCWLRSIFAKLAYCPLTSLHTKSHLTWGCCAIKGNVGIHVVNLKDRLFRDKPSKSSVFMYETSPGKKVWPTELHLTGHRYKLSTNSILIWYDMMLITSRQFDRSPPSFFINTTSAVSHEKRLKPRVNKINR